MTIATDWAIDYTNKRIYHTTGNEIFSVNELYSHLMDTFDDLAQMDDTVPMTAQTPTAYTMVNQWFIDDESTQYLDGGAIATSGYNGQIQVLTLLAAGYVSAVSTDIGKTVTEDGGGRGALLAYNNTTRKWWIRTTTTITAAGVMAITAGTGAGTAAANSGTGEELYANIYTLGTIESAPAPQVYIYQSGISLSEWSNLSNWDRGHIDILVKVKEADTEIAGGIVTVYARQYQDLYDHFSIDLTAGGRNAVPLATSADLNNTTGSYYLLYDGATGSFTAGEIIRNWTTSGTAEVISDSSIGAPPSAGLLELGGVKGTFPDDGGFSGQTSAVVGSSNGEMGGTYLQYDNPQSVFATVPQMVYGQAAATSRVLRGLDAINSSMVLDVSGNISGSSITAYSRIFTDNEAISGNVDGWASANITLTGLDNAIVSDFQDITVAFVNGTATHGGTTGTFTAGERIQWNATGNAIVLLDDSNVVTLGNVTAPAFNGKTAVGDLSDARCTFSQNLQPGHTMNKAFEQGTNYPYDVIIECGSIYNAGRTLSDVYEYLKFVTREESMYTTYPLSSAIHSGLTGTPISGESYILAYGGYSPVKSAPFGTFAGGVLFGAQGVWVEGMDSADIQNYQLIDSDGTTQTPPNWITIRVNAVISGDRVSVFRTSGSSSDVDKWMYYASGTFNVEGLSVFAISTTLAVDTPPDGYIRLVSGTSEYRYKYDSWVSSNMFVLSSGVGLGTSFDGIDSRNSCYIPFLDAQTSTTYIEDSVIYASDRSVITRVRKYGGAGSSIIPFQVAGSVTSAGLTVAAIRTDDTIVT